MFSSSNFASSFFSFSFSFSESGCPCCCCCCCGSWCSSWTRSCSISSSSSSSESVSDSSSSSSSSSSLFLFFPFLKLFQFSNSASARSIVRKIADSPNDNVYIYQIIRQKAEHFDIQFTKPLFRNAATLCSVGALLSRSVPGTAVYLGGGTTFLRSGTSLFWAHL